MASPASPADSGSAAAAAAEQPLTLLHLPGELLAHIACFLDVDGGACERLCLAATCRTLLAASRQQPSWWRRLGLVLRGSSRPLSGFAGISAWLAKHRPGIAALSVKQEGRSSSLPAWDLRLPSPPLPSLVDLKLQHSSVSSAVMAGLMAHTSLTRLALLSNGYPNYLDDLPASISNLSRLAVLQLDCSPGKLHRLAPLSQLRGLELGWVSVAQEWEQLARTLPHLRPLTSLLLHSQLHDTERRLPDTLTLLTSLAAVQLVCFAQPGQWAPVLAAAAAEDQRLTRLVLERCSQQLQEIPAELASLTALQHLTIKVGRYDDPAQIVGGLQHLAGLPLTHLALERCEAVLPPQASTLTALRNLSLSCRFPAGAAASPARIPQLGTGAQLQFLALLQCPMPPAGPAWQRLSSLGHLTRLEVQQAEGQEWPAALASLTALKELWLGDAFWGNGSWQLLAGLCQLTRMELPLGWRPSAADMQLSNCPPALLHLTVRGVTRELQPAVARHSSLTHLAFVGSSSAGQLQHASWPALRSVEGLPAAQLAGLASVAPLSQLTSLELRCSSRRPLPVTLAQCTALCTLALSLSKREYLDDGGGHLASLQQLTSLAVQDDWGSKGTLAVPPSVSTLIGLKRLTFTRADKLNSDTLRHLRPLTRLTHLSLPGFVCSLLPAFVRERQGLGLSITGLKRI